MKSSLLWMSLAALTFNAVAAPPADPGPVVELPPMLVESTGTSAPRWLYGRLPGFEVLSCASSDATEDLTLRLYRLRAQLAQLVPPELQVQRDEPFTLIVYPQSRAESLSQALNEQLSQGQTEQRASGHVHTPPNLNLSDPDSLMLFLVVEDRVGPTNWYLGAHSSSGNRYDGIVYSADYIRRLFEDRTPALPPWFVYGMAKFYSTLVTTDDGLEFAPDEWLSPAAAETARRDEADAFRPTLPLAELFRGASPPPAVDPASREHGDLWLAEAELFVRWAVDGRSHRHYQARAALWKIAEAAAHAPVTEELFRQYFGMGFSDARDELSDTLSRAVLRPVELDLDSEPALPDLHLQLATPADIHRIKGDWARRTLRLVRENHPALLPIYERQAREVLEGAYEQGERDPRLVADLGLLCSEVGSFAEARRYLEEGAKAGPMRPAALAELARLRLQPYLDPARAGPGRPPPADVESILTPIRAARRLQPPQLLSYLVVRALWGLDPARATREERDLLVEGAEYFPSRTDLVLSAVYQFVRSGDRSRVLRAADMGLWTGTDSKLLARLKSARNALQENPTK